TLFFEFHGTSDDVVNGQAAAVEEIVREHGALAFDRASTPEDRARLWQARHDVFYATVASRPGATAWTTDVCVPISRLAACIVETQADAEDAGIPAPLVGHAGDGNFHLILMIHPGDEQEMAKVAAFCHRLVERTLAMGGTCTGEHGVGIGKMGYLQEEHGEALRVMRAIKRALDPDEIMNPGKMIPEEPGRP